MADHLKFILHNPLVVGNNFREQTALPLPIIQWHTPLCKRQNKDILSSELPSTLVIWSSADKMMRITAPTFQLRSVVIVSFLFIYFTTDLLAPQDGTCSIPAASVVPQVLTVCTHLGRTEDQSCRKEWKLPSCINCTQTDTSAPVKEANKNSEDH